MNSLQMLDQMKIILQKHMGSKSPDWVAQELLMYLNNSQRFVQNEIVALAEEIFITSTTIATVGGTEKYALPTSCLSVVMLEDNNYAVPIKYRRIDMSQRGRFFGIYPFFINLRIGQRSCYYMAGSQIGIVPVPTVANNLTLSYIQACTDLDGTASTTTILPLEYHEVLIAAAIVEAMGKLGLTIPTIERQTWTNRLQALLDRMIKTFQNRRSQEVQFVKKMK